MGVRSKILVRTQRWSSTPVLSHQAAESKARGGELSGRSRAVTRAGSWPLVFPGAVLEHHPHIALPGSLATSLSHFWKLFFVSIILHSTTSLKYPALKLMRWCLNSLNSSWGSPMSRTISGSLLSFSWSSPWQKDGRRMLSWDGIH